MRGRILVADDEQTMRDVFRETLSDQWDVRVAADGNQASDLLSEESFDLAFLDIRMPGPDGPELLRRIRRDSNLLPTILMSAHAGAERRRELLAGGATRFLEKPLLPSDIETLVEELLGVSHEAPTRLIASDEATQAVLSRMARVAKTRATVLLSGETGSGKEVLARFLHERSDRAHRPFVQVNCATLSDTLVESELFGHERGSFTGAARAHDGLFVAAHGGTLLLDEISEISPPMQAKLLRALQEREVRRVGGTASIAVDARIVATTNRDLREEVQSGNFREDLYHRLNVVRVNVPPLRERLGDIVPLAEATLDRKSLEHGTTRPELAPEAAERLKEHTWPGNVRELENTVERALLLHTGPCIESKDLEFEETSAGAAQGAPVGTTIDDAERDLILRTLEAVHGNRTRASSILGISVRTMRNKLRAYREAGLWEEEEK